MSADELPPLTDPSSGAPASLRALLEAGKRDVPSAAEIAGVEAKLAPLFGAAASVPAAAGSGVLAMAGLATLGGALVITGVWLSRPDEKPSAPDPKSPPATTAEARTPPAVAAPPSIAPPPAAPVGAPSAAEVPAAEAPNKTPQNSPKARVAAVPEDALLEQARRALGSDPQRALALAREHQTAYPGGVLAQEREVIAIEALRRLGRTEEAAKRRERFERMFPQSVHRRKLEQPSK